MSSKSIIFFLQFQFFNDQLLKWCLQHGGAQLYDNLCERKRTEIKPARKLANFGRMFTVFQNYESRCTIIEQYSPYLDSWIEICSIPEILNDFISVSWDKNLMILGVIAVGDTYLYQNTVSSFLLCLLYSLLL